jgi:formate dehydrogenase
MLEIAKAPHGILFGERPFGHFHKSLCTDDKRIHACPADLEKLLHERLAGPLQRPDVAQWPLQLITRRRVHMMNSWLADTTATKMRKMPGGQVEVNRDDAAKFGLADGARVRVRSRVGEIKAEVLVSDAVRPGVVVMDHGWGSRLFDPATGRVVSCEGVNRNLLIANDDLDPLTDVPRLNGMPVALQPDA